MNILLVGINSKYIHTNLAIRYLKANCDHDTFLCEYTIKDNIDKIFKDIIEKKPDIVAFSIYIWNINIIKNLSHDLKAYNKSIKIIYGGPEVSYDSTDLLKDNFCDYIISGEGEIAFDLLIKDLVDNKDKYDIDNLIYIDNNKVVKNPKCEIPDLNSLKNPYVFEFDKESIKNKIAYVELSRGCPYHCSYCQASLENRLRYFNIEKVIENIEYLYKTGARTFKFLDRSFNIKPVVAMQFFKYIIERDFKNAVFQFEINGDILNDEMIDYLNQNSPSNLIRFEIGIQSTNDLVNEAIYRRQNTLKLLKNIRKLIEGPITLHLDLIAGLPEESLESFIDTFDSVFKLHAKELQLGFLKILKGTRLSYELEKYGYVVSKEPPYEIISNNFLDQKDLYKIHLVEDVLDTFWNKGFMYNSVIQATKDLDSPFEFFYELALYINEIDFSLHDYQLDELFSAFNNFIKKSYPENLDITDYLKYDYLKHYNIKPKLFWDNSEIKKNEIIRKFHSYNPQYKIDDLYKYALVTKYLNKYLIIIYFPQEKTIHIF